MADTKKFVEQKREEMLDRLIEAIENNPAMWEKGWYSMGAAPINASSKKPYRGLNAFFLSLTDAIKGYDDNRWVTFNQALKMGAPVKAGEKSSSVFFWTKYDFKTKKEFDVSVLADMEEEDKREYLRENVRNVLKFYSVFNAKQCENFPENVKQEMSEDERQKQNENIEKIIANSAAPIFYDGNGEAYYQPSSDTIHLPKIEDFKTKNNYYATALHEIGHSTGHESRLNRDFGGGFGSETYAIEELRAELACVFMQSDMNIDLSGAEVANHAAYLRSWLNVVKQDKDVFFKAAADADKIVKYISDNYLNKEVAKQDEEVTTQEKTQYVSPKEYYAAKNAKRLEQLQANVPDEMKNLPNWCVYKTRWNEEKGKKDKSIFSPLWRNVELKGEQIVDSSEQNTSIRIKSGKYATYEFSAPTEMVKKNTESGSIKLSIKLDNQYQLYKKGKSVKISGSELCSLIGDSKMTWASVDKPDTWATFDEAMKFAKEHNCEGLSFALDKKSRIVCIDLDHCIADKGMRSELCWDILNSSSGTYAEKSVSGTGVHVFFKADDVVNGYSKKNDENGIECYDSSKFISMTGNLISKSNNLVDTPKELIETARGKLGELPERAFAAQRSAGDIRVSMSDSELIDKIRESKVGDDFVRMFDNGENLCNDKSRTDAKLMSILAFFTDGNAGQMKSIFMSSSLYRADKGEKYLDRTVEYAIRTLKTRPSNLGKVSKAIKPQGKAPSKASSQSGK